MFVNRNTCQSLTKVKIEMKILGKMEPCGNRETSSNGNTEYHKGVCQSGETLCKGNVE